MAIVPNGSAAAAFYRRAFHALTASSVSNPAWSKARGTRSQSPGRTNASRSSAGRPGPGLRVPGDELQAPGAAATMTTVL